MSKTITILHDGEPITHMAGSYGDYKTVCGCDGNDEFAGQLPAKVQRKKVTCDHCWLIWQYAQDFKASDFRIKK